MDSTLLAIFAAFVAGVVFGYMVREGISRRRRARERRRFHYDNEAYGDATLIPGWHGELQNMQGSKTLQPGGHTPEHTAKTIFREPEGKA
jgi:hypothetical protein